uniref:RNA-dependent RNA polymerase n=1 Tax=Parasteatoda tepidariorum TaxID=114398 RepID=A0A2L2Y470_PARTP
MEVINFRTVIVPEEKYATDDDIAKKFKTYLEQLTFHFEACGLMDVSLSFLKVKKSEEEDTPEIEELIIQVSAKCLLRDQDWVHYCRQLRSEWKNLFYPNPTPILAFYESKSFSSSRKHSHVYTAYKTISFGILPHDGAFHQYSSLESDQSLDSHHVNFYHDSRSVTIKYEAWELVFPYSNIKNVFVNIDSNSHEIFFDLCNPPLIFETEQRYSKYIGNYQIRHRSATITTGPSCWGRRRNNNYLPVGERRALFDVETLGKATVMKLSFTNAIIVEEIVSRIHARCGGKPIHYAYIVTKQKEKPDIPDVNWNHFGSTYMITSIFKRSFTVPSQTSNIHTSLRVLEKFSSQNGDCLEKALTLVLSTLESGKIMNYWHAIERQYYFYLNHKDEMDYMHYIVPEKCRLIRRITVTPTRQLLWPPEIMFGNRVLRKFDPEYAIRVSFRDDDNSRLSFNAANAEPNILEYSIRKPMSTGILIGSRHYEFLAWSNSQIRDHGIWTYARDTEGNTVQHIRSWMGDFSHIHSVPKYMARMGQCFSQTEDAVTVPLDPRHIRTEPDIERGCDLANGGKPYCFSDGIGRISTNLATEVRNALGHDKLCSAFQIRYGGYKGMLVVDPTLKDADIVFRKSMKKFDSPQNQRLEIAKTSAPISLQLNKPFIALLNDLGVRHSTFLRLQENMLRNLTDMLFEEEQAAEFLASKTPSEIFKYKEISRSGIFLTTEPFFRSLLLALHRHHVENIKKRANIIIDPSLGRNMLGVLDETGLLQEGEVFVKYTKDISKGETTHDTVILRGEVLVTKNPCVLPGDVRKFTAVDRAEVTRRLGHIVDCIVFPQNGRRPHPTEMSGSDLDGDEYAVLWFKDLIIHAANHRPGHFPSASIPDKAVITVNDMIECLINYIKNDQVGTIANAHLAHADRDDIFSEICIDIAKKNSYAVDFAKTGVSKSLDQEERPNVFPDFMEKHHKETYKSKKALGKMFRVVKDFESENEYASITYRDVQVDQDLIFPGWEIYREDAVKSRNKFNTLLKTVLRNYGIQHEAEVFSGAFTNLHCRFQERKDKAEIEKIVVRCIKRLAKSMREEFLEEFKECSNINEAYLGMLRKASAWYVVTYRDGDGKFLSFPWTVSDYLANIKVKKVPTQESLFSPIVAKMDQQIKSADSQRWLPNFSESNEWNQYNYLCGDPNIVKSALRVLILWAEDEDIIEKPGGRVEGLMFKSSFIKLFLHVAEVSQYIIKKGKRCDVPKGKLYSPASLCIEFWRFCVKLRFYNKREVLEIIPFQVYKYGTLSKRAVVTYHRFAVLGEFENLYFESGMAHEKMEMKPLNINNKVFPRSPIDENSLKLAAETLVKYSSADNVELREILQTKKVLVSARGSEQSLKTLKTILNEKQDFIAQLFSTGVMPES